MLLGKNRRSNNLGKTKAQNQTHLWDMCQKKFLFMQNFDLFFSVEKIKQNLIKFKNVSKAPEKVQEKWVNTLAVIASSLNKHNFSQRDAWQQIKKLTEISSLMVLDCGFEHTTNPSVPYAIAEKLDQLFNILGKKIAVLKSEVKNLDFNIIDKGFDYYISIVCQFGELSISEDTELQNWTAIDGYWADDEDDKVSPRGQYSKRQRL